ncbi:MAG TPA: dephospho-CoA kinase [Casimicrobiaceae bacterium]|nr:dephospho-CoA kinase [Casimicrobiaceae bacterium]
MPYVVGLTGGIGSGKTEVARAFEALGVETADADAAAHAVTAKGEAGYRAVVEAFGPGAMAPDGRLDRAWLRQTVFADPGARARLEALLHPLILARVESQISRWRGPYGLLVVPLLLERGNARSRVSRVLVVDCPEEEQVRRVTARSGLPASEVRAIMATQLTRRERLAQADDIVDNGGPLESLPPQVARLDAFYRECAARAREP